MRLIPNKRSLARACATVLVAAAALMLLALPAAVAGAAEKGLNVDMTWGTSSSDQTRTAGLLPALGAKWVRLWFAWKDIEPRQGSYSSSTLSAYDSAVSLARQNGAKIDVTIDQTPSWASAGDANAPPANPANFASIMSFLANRYRGQVAGWEIWNEENTSRFWSTGPNAAQYTAMLKAAYPAIKAADPSALVVFGGTWTNDYNFLESAYQAGAKGYFDVMATHPYPAWGGAPDAIAYDNGRISAGSFAGYREVHNVMLAHGEDKPIWLTEFGWSTENGDGGGVSLSQQADYVTRAFCVAAHDPYVTVGLLYEFRNNYWASNANDWEDSLGLMYTDYSPKPAYFSFANYTQGVTPCPASTTSQPAGSPPQTTTTPAGSPPQTTTTSQPGQTASALRTDSRLASTTVVRIRRLRTRAARAAQIRRVKVLLVGLVRGAHGGRVSLDLRRAGTSGTWQAASAPAARVSSIGRFQIVTFASPGRWRVRAQFRGDSRTRPSTSRIVYFRV